MKLSDAALRKIIRAYVGCIRDAGVHVQEVRLFGSRASGKAHTWSDIDLCIISPQFGKDWQREIVKLLLLASSLDSPVPIEPIPFGPDDLADRYSTLATEVRKHGKIIKI